ncbi:MAG: WD40 repeat domain-containing protein [Bryobacteraceae bacterium]
MIPAVSRLAIDDQNPWPGLSAFDEGAQRFFNGRREESAALRRLVMQAPLTVLFAASGLGKTSLLQAGLFPLLRKDALPVYVRLDPNERETPLIDQVKAALQAEILQRRVDAPKFRAAESLWEYLHRAGLEFWSEDNHLLTPLFVFDQFEEVFTLGAGNAAAVTRLRTDLADLIENRMPASLAARDEEDESTGHALSLDSPRYKVLLSFREDFLAAIEGWKRDIPSLLRNRLRLLPMSGDQAFEAVNSTAPHLAPEPIARRIVSFVAAAGEDSGESADLEVAPALLSLVCHGLNERRKEQGKTAFDDALLTGTGQAIVADFYRNAVAGVGQPVQRFIERELITERGFRKPCDVDDARTVHGVTDRDLALLVDRRVLRIEPGRGTERVELTHDLLTGVVREHRDRQREKERVSRQRRRLGIFSAVGVMLAGLVVVFGLLYRSADRERGVAETQKERADGALEKATEALAREQVSREAEKKQREIAQEQSMRAEQLTLVSISRQLAAQAISRLDDSLDLALLLGVEALAVADTAEARNGLLTGLEHNPHLKAFLGQGRGRLAISPDGKAVAAGTEDESITIWDLTTLRPRTVLKKAFEGSPEGVVSVAFSPDGKTLASGATRGTMRLWDVTTGKLLREFTNVHSNGGVGRLMFAPSGKVLASGGGTHLVLWDVATGEAISKRLTTAWSLAYSPDGAKLASSGTSKIELWDGATGEPLAPLVTTEQLSTHVAFSPDGAKLAAGTTAGGIVLWNVTTGDQSASLVRTDWSIDKTPSTEVNRSEHAVTDLAFSPDGKLLVSGNLDHTISLWNVVVRGRRGRGATHTQTATLRGHKAGVWSVGFLKDSRTFVSGGEDGRILLWTTDTAQRRESAVPVAEALPGGLRSVAYSPNGHELIGIWDADNEVSKIVRWDAKTGKRNGPTLQTPAKWISQVTFGSNGKMLALGSARNTDRGELVVWDVGKVSPVGPPLKGLESPVALSPDGKMVASTNGDGSITLWDVATGKPLGNHVIVLSRRPIDTLDLFLFGPASRAEALAFSQDSRTLAAGLCAGYFGSAQSISGRYRGTDCRRGEIDLWDLTVRQPVGHRIAAHGDAVRNIAFSSDGRTLASASKDGIMLRDATTGDAIGPVLEVTNNMVSSMAFTPDSRILTLATRDGPVRWKVDPNSWAARSCGIANRNLTQPEWEQYFPGKPYNRTCPTLPNPLSPKTTGVPGNK